MNDALRQAADKLESHSHVDSVRTEPDDLDDVLFVRLDWVTESHRDADGTRIIMDKEYDGHIKKVSDAVKDCDGVTRTRMMDSGLYGRTIVVEPGQGRWS